MPLNAPYSGGFSAGAKLFAVDGDFTFASPCSPPMNIESPFKGDSFPSMKDIILLDQSGTYVSVPLGQGYNVQPFSANQSCIVFDQEFMVAQAYHVPLPLNTPYNMNWSIGWQGTYANLASAFLVAEGPLEDMGGGIVKFRRTFATLPPTRNEMESFCYTFPPLSNGTDLREAKSKVVASRVQFDYYVYDDLDILSWIPLFPAGRRLNATTGLSPSGLILPEMRYFKAGANAVTLNLLCDGDQPLVNESSVGAGDATKPTFSEYTGWAWQKEIVAESSILGPGPWLGNIYQRRTRFVIAQ